MAQSDTIGKYEILGEIGRGGMGAVYKARDPLLDRVVAVKTVLTSGLEPATRARFQREARSAARLQHPNIVTIFEFGEVDDIQFIAMELLEGVDLAEAALAGRLPELENKLAVIVQLCKALAYAHQHGVIHRDIKPRNVILLGDGTAKVVDFGIARIEGSTAVTQTNQLLGTLAYMAPEQFSGAASDHRVDVWALGVILYELLSGGRPFDGKTVPALIHKIVAAPPRPLDAAQLRLPAELISVVDTALEKNPAARYPDAAAMGEAVRQLLSGTPARPPLPPEPVRQTGSPDTTVAYRQPQAARQPQVPGTVSRRLYFRETDSFGDDLALHVIAPSPDQKVLAVGGFDGSIRIWNVATRLKEATLRSRLHLRIGHGALTTAVAFATDNSLLATGHLDGAIYLWKPGSAQELDASLRHEGAVGGLGFAAANTTLASGGADSTLKYWEMAAIVNGEARRQLRRQPAEVTALAVADQGATIITGHSNRTIRVHDAASGRLIATLHGHRAAPSALASSPNGTLLASGGRDHTVRIYDIRTRNQLFVCEGHGRAVASLAFFPDGLRVASVAQENFLVIWDVETGQKACTLEGASGERFTSVALLDQGRIACGLTDGRIRLWEPA